MHRKTLIPALLATTLIGIAPVEAFDDAEAAKEPGKHSEAIQLIPERAGKVDRESTENQPAQLRPMGYEGYLKVTEMSVDASLALAEAWSALMERATDKAAESRARSHAAEARATCDAMRAYAAQFGRHPMVPGYIEECYGDVERVFVDRHDGACARFAAAIEEYARSLNEPNADEGWLSWTKQLQESIATVRKKRRGLEC